MAKKKVREQTLGSFSSVSNDKKSAERNLGAELFNKNWQEEKIDAFEKGLGIDTSKKQDVQYKHKVKIFQPSADKDRDLLTELMNSPKHTITYWKDNWTALGEYLVFVVYTEEITKED